MRRKPQRRGHLSGTFSLEQSQQQGEVTGTQVIPKLGEATREMELLPVILYTSSYSWIWSGLPQILEIPVFGLVKANTFRLELVQQLLGPSAGMGSPSSAETAWQSLK